MKRKTFPPILSMQMAYFRMLTEAQTVVALRLAGMMGLLPAHPGENSRMVNEKAPAFAEAAWDAWWAASTGAAPDRVAAAWVKPIGRRTRSNARRLSRRR